jgi:hypothetical protein
MCRHVQESLWGADGLASCYGCHKQIPAEKFGAASVRRSVAICANCGDSVGLKPPKNPIAERMKYARAATLSPLTTWVALHP